VSADAVGRVGFPAQSLDRFDSRMLNARTELLRKETIVVEARKVDLRTAAGLPRRQVRCGARPPRPAKLIGFLIR